MSIFKEGCLQEKQIGIVPELGYEKNHQASDIAIKWLEWEAKKRNRTILHAGIGDEHRIGSYKVDGYLIPTEEEENKKVKPTAFEFLGCVWHGCTT
ncbi:MAG TPA: hypothetical protein VFV08_00465 [Puia sp.]|nr:hypothetical protein [Puia sp.]